MNQVSKGEIYHYHISTYSSSQSIKDINDACDEIAISWCGWRDLGAALDRLPREFWLVHIAQWLSLGKLLHPLWNSHLPASLPSYLIHKQFHLQTIYQMLINHAWTILFIIIIIIITRVASSYWYTMRRSTHVKSLQKIAKLCFSLFVENSMRKGFSVIINQTKWF